MNCDRIATVYQFLEYCAFGNALDKRRFEFLPQAIQARRALILGSGDGRFTAKLSAANPRMEIDCVELSAKMIEIAKHRISAQIGFIEGDARAQAFTHFNYDLIVANFFFDCFPAPELPPLVSRVTSVCAPGALWIVSEFQQPPSGWRRWHAQAWLNTMYLFFRLSTGLTTTKISPHAEALKASGFRLKSQASARAGLIASELWQLDGQLNERSSES